MERIVKGLPLHLPTVQKILSEVEIYQKDKNRLNVLKLFSLVKSDTK